MKSKFKDYLLYSLACVGVVSLFISATTQIPEENIWEMHSTSNDDSSHVFSINKRTGEVRKHETKYDHANDYFGDWKQSQNNKHEPVKKGWD